MRRLWGVLPNPHATPAKDDPSLERDQASAPEEVLFAAASERCIQYAVRLYDEQSAHGWKADGEDKALEPSFPIRFFRKETKGLPINKATLRIRAPPGAVADLVRDLDAFRDIHGFIEKFLILEKPSSQSRVVYVQYSSAPMISARDFCVLETSRVLPDSGCHVVAYTSIEHSKCSEVASSRNTRGTVKVQGFVLRPVEGDPLSCDATYIQQVDLNGYIPGYVQRQVGRKLCTILRGLAKRLRRTNPDFSKYLAEQQGSPAAQSEPSTTAQRAPAGAEEAAATAHALSTEAPLSPSVQVLAQKLDRIMALLVFMQVMLIAAVLVDAYLVMGK